MSDNTPAIQLSTQPSTEHTHEYESKYDYQQLVDSVQKCYDQVVANALPNCRRSADGLPIMDIYRTYDGPVDLHPMWDAYLAAFDTPEERQHYTCFTCRHFFQRYADLVTIGAGGTLTSLMWDPNLVEDPFLKTVVERLKNMAENGRVTEYFFIGDEKLVASNVLGVPTAGGYNHVSINLGEVTIEVGNENRAMIQPLRDSLRDYPVNVIEKALAIIQLPNSMRKEVDLDPMVWFLETAADAQHLKGNRLHNFIWKQANVRPSNFAKPRATSLARILDAVKSGVPVDTIVDTRNKTVDPVNYRRVKAEEVSKGQIDAAEKCIRDLGLTNSFAQRYATMDDILKHMDIVWKPTDAQTKPVGDQGGDLFAPLRAKLDKTTSLANTKISGGKISMVNFYEIMAKAKEMRVLISGDAALGIMFFSCQVNQEAGGITYWDLEERRNPIIPYMYDRKHPLIGAQGASLGHGSWVRVTAVTPLVWASGPAKDVPSIHPKEGALFFLEGARDAQPQSMWPLFPEILRSDLFQARRVIENLGRTQYLSGDHEEAIGALRFQPGATSAMVQVVDQNDVTAEYEIVLWS